MGLEENATRACFSIDQLQQDSDTKSVQDRACSCLISWLQGRKVSNKTCFGLIDWSQGIQDLNLIS